MGTLLAGQSILHEKWPKHTQRTAERDGERKRERTKEWALPRIWIAAGSRLAVPPDYRHWMRNASLCILHASRTLQFVCLCNVNGFKCSLPQQTATNGNSMDALEQRQLAYTNACSGVFHVLQRQLSANAVPLQRHTIENTGKVGVAGAKRFCIRRCRHARRQAIILLLLSRAVESF